MKKLELLELLSAVPGNPEVCIVDTEKNDLASPNTIASLERGVYPKFSFKVKNLLDTESDDSPKWVGLEFETSQLKPVIIDLQNKINCAIDTIDE